MSSHHNELQDLVHDLKWHLRDHFEGDCLVEGKKVDVIRVAQAVVPQKAFIPPPQTPNPVPPPTKTIAAPVKPAPLPKTFDVEPVQFETISPLNDIKQFYQLNAPQIKLAPTPDEIKKGIEVKKSVVLLLSFSSHHLNFLKNVAKAIEIKFNLPCTVELVDEKYIWKERGFKKVIASEYGIDGYFKSHIKEEGCLGLTPLIALPDLTQYLKEPLLKRSLWQTLCQELRKLSST